MQIENSFSKANLSITARGAQFFCGVLVSLSKSFCLNKTRSLLVAGTVLFLTAGTAGADTGTAEAYLKQAQAYQDTGKTGDARKLFEQALREAYAVGQNNPKLPEVLESVADFYRSQSEFQKAEDTYRRALQMVETRQGKMSSDVAKLNQKMGQLLLGENKYQEAEQHFRTALDIYEKKLDRDKNVPNFNRKETNLLVAECLDDLARCVRNTTGQFAADGLSNRSQQIRANPSADHSNN
jgi:tetratricopeptide (TPR) repeat protein